MNILLVGYGKMGKMVETIASERNHHIIGKISSEQGNSLEHADFTNVDMVIEFTQPTVAYHNIKFCLEKRVPIVSGTTGWTDKMPEIKSFCADKKGAFFYASNFSIGFNMMMILNEMLAKLMNQYPEYEVKIDETHHIHKKDEPSGTAITLANGILEKLNRKNNWLLNQTKMRMIY